MRNHCFQFRDFFYHRFGIKEIAAQAVKPVWPLYDLLPEREWESARQQLGLDSFVWLVENAEL
ncbi:hypothetical protein MJH54_31410, partial [Salmonella enterica subsp. enterica serovar Montevideo]|nr:hypothetical protein [Salmonella enterica subsp. enterica serovar Montevideo]